MNNAVEFNFVKPGLFDLPESDWWGFSPNDSNLIEIQSGWSLADIVVQMGVFSSKNQARKNGWSGEIPEGFSTLERVGKLKKRANIHNASNFFLEDSNWGKDVSH